MYPELMVIPMREELVRAGIEETRTAEDVDAALAQPGTTMLVVNSICGCAAGKMRPGVRMALANSATLPDRKITALCHRAVHRPADCRRAGPCLRRVLRQDPGLAHYRKLLEDPKIYSFQSYFSPM